MHERLTEYGKTLEQRKNDAIKIQEMREKLLAPFKPTVVEPRGRSRGRNESQGDKFEHLYKVKCHANFDSQCSSHYKLFLYLIFTICIYLTDSKGNTIARET